MDIYIYGHLDGHIYGHLDGHKDIQTDPYCIIIKNFSNSVFCS